MDNDRKKSLELVNTDEGEKCMTILSGMANEKKKKYLLELADYRVMIDFRTHVLIVNFLGVFLFALGSLWLGYLNYSWEKKSMFKSRNLIDDLERTRKSWLDKVKNT